MTDEKEVIVVISVVCGVLAAVVVAVGVYLVVHACCCRQKKHTRKASRQNRSRYHHRDQVPLTVQRNERLRQHRDYDPQSGVDRQWLGEQPLYAEMPSSSHGPGTTASTHKYETPSSFGRYAGGQPSGQPPEPLIWSCCTPPTGPSPPLPPVLTPNSNTAIIETREQRKERELQQTRKIFPQAEVADIYTLRKVFETPFKSSANLEPQPTNGSEQSSCHPALLQAARPPLRNVERSPPRALEPALEGRLQSLVEMDNGVISLESSALTVQASGRPTGVQHVTNVRKKDVAISTEILRTCGGRGDETHAKHVGVCQPSSESQFPPVNDLVAPLQSSDLSGVDGPARGQCIAHLMSKAAIEKLPVETSREQSCMEAPLNDISTFRLTLEDALRSQDPPRTYAEHNVGHQVQLEPVKTLQGPTTLGGE